MIRLTPILALALLAGCATPIHPAQTSEPAAAADAAAAGGEIYRKTFDFGHVPPGEVKDPFGLHEGVNAVVLTVRWITPAPALPFGTQIKLEDPEGENALECELPPGPVPAAPCEATAASPAAGTWDVEYEGGGPGLRAAVVVTEE